MKTPLNFKQAKDQLKFKEVFFKECVISLMNTCSLLKFQGKPLVGRVKGGFMTLNFKVAFTKKNELPLLKGVLFVKPPPGSKS